MKSFSFGKALTLGCLVCLVLPVACGDDDDTTAKPGTGGEPGAAGQSATEGGAGGAAPALMVPGTSDMTKTIKCGTAMCSSVKTIIPGPVYVNPCCAGDAGDACGVDTQFFGILKTGFKEVCQAVHQEGPVDTGCPDSAEQMIMVQGAPFSVPGFAGCCRADTGTCGVVIDQIPVTGIPLPFAAPMLGCADATPFFAPGTVAKACGAGGNGAGGGGGAGPGPEVGGAASGGASTGGAGGNP